MAEKYYRRAKDVIGLYAAVEAKLTEQRDFVVWWDAHEHKGGNPTVTGLKRLEDFGVDRITVHRWRGKLKAPEKYDATLFEKALRMVEKRRGDLAGPAEHGGDRRSEEFQVPCVVLEKTPKQTLSRWRTIARNWDKWVWPELPSRVGARLPLF